MIVNGDADDAGAGIFKHLCRHRIDRVADDRVVAGAQQGLCRKIDAHLGAVSDDEVFGAGLYAAGTLQVTG